MPSDLNICKNILEQKTASYDLLGKYMETIFDKKSIQEAFEASALNALPQPCLHVKNLEIRNLDSHKMF